MGSIYTRLGSGIVEAHGTLESVGQALTAGATLTDANGTPIETREFMGGLLLGPYALPMNVILYGTWYPTQKDILQPYWDSGVIPRPPAPTVALETVDPAASSSMLPLLLAGAAAFLLFRRKR